jgi:hypothetical protein
MENWAFLGENKARRAPAARCPDCPAGHEHYWDPRRFTSKQKRGTFGALEERTVSGWSDCIVVLIDLIGIKKRALEGDSGASASMRSFHNLVQREVCSDLRTLDHAYLWNDSVLLFAYVNDRSGMYERAIHAADSLKRKIDLINPSYAIAVKGRAFPFHTGTGCTKVTVIKASSYAMANCFEIEAEAKRRKLHNKFWYIDVRIARKVYAAKAPDWIDVTLLPKGHRRRVYVHRGYLWNEV